MQKAIARHRKLTFDRTPWTLPSRAAEEMGRWAPGLALRLSGSAILTGSMTFSITTSGYNSTQEPGTYR